MKANLIRSLLALAVFVPLGASAHKMFLVPSTTVLSDADDAWITVDAAVSNDLFYFNHHALDLDGLRVIGPDGADIAVENRNTGKWRSTFDLHLAQPGTYRIALVSDGFTASYLDAKGEKKRWRGKVDGLKDIPADAKDLEITEYQASVNTYATLGKPNDTALKPGGKGLELQAVTAPNDLFAQEAATFRLLIDGKPAAGLKVTAIPGGTRYRNAAAEIETTTGANGEFSVTWPSPGLYWISAVAEGQPATNPKAKQRRLSYAGTFEVLPQ